MWGQPIADWLGSRQRHRPIRSCFLRFLFVLALGATVRRVRSPPAELPHRTTSKMQMLTVPVETTVYLGAVGVILVMLGVFYLYLSKKVCFTTIGGFPCCDGAVSSRERERQVIARNLGAAYAYDDVESSSESDEEVIQQLHHSASLQGGFLNSTSARKVSSMGHSTDHAHGNGHLPQPDLVSLAENGRRIHGGRGSGSSRHKQGFFQACAGNFYCSHRSAV
ncbi:hypothetical protein MTO96_007256 [Rhipicephalus appendiculatus]